MDTYICRCNWPIPTRGGTPSAHAALALQPPPTFTSCLPPLIHTILKDDPGCAGGQFTLPPLSTRWKLYPVSIAARKPQHGCWVKCEMWIVTATVIALAVINCKRSADIAQALPFVKPPCGFLWLQHAMNHWDTQLVSTRIQVPLPNLPILLINFLWNERIFCMDCNSVHATINNNLWR